MGIDILTAMVKGLTYERLMDRLSTFGKLTFEQAQVLIIRLEVHLGLLLNTPAKDMTMRKWKRMVRLFAMRAVLSTVGSIGSLVDMGKELFESEGDTYDPDMELPFEARMLLERLRNLAQEMGSLKELVEYTNASLRPVGWISKLKQTGDLSDPKHPFWAAQPNRTNTLFSSGLSWRRLLTVHITKLIRLLYDNKRRKGIWVKIKSLEQYKALYPSMNWEDTYHKGEYPTGVTTHELAELIGLRIAFGFHHEAHTTGDEGNVSINLRRLNVIETKRTARLEEYVDSFGNRYTIGDYQEVMLARGHTDLADLERPTDDLSFYVKDKWKNAKDVWTGPHWVDHQHNPVIRELMGNQVVYTITNKQVMPGYGSQFAYQEWIKLTPEERNTKVPTIGKASKMGPGGMRPSFGSPFWAYVYHLIMTEVRTNVLKEKDKLFSFTPDFLRRHPWAANKAKRAAKTGNLRRVQLANGKVYYHILPDVGVSMDIPITSLKGMLNLPELPGNAHFLRVSLRGPLARTLYHNPKWHWTPTSDSGLTHEGESQYNKERE